MKKLISLLLALVLVFALAACGGNEAEQSKPDQSVEASSEPEPASVEESSEPEPASVEESSEPEPASVEESSEEPSEPEPPKEYFDFTKTASSVSVDGTVTGESVVIFTTDSYAKSGNCKWSINVLLHKTADCLYEVVSVAAGSGSDWDGTFEEDQILLAVHSSSSNMDDIETYQNVPGKLAAAALQPGDLIAIVGIEEKDIQLLKEYEEGVDKLEYVKELAANINKFVSFQTSAIGTGTNANQNTSVILTGVNSAPAYGSVTLYTREGWGDTLGANGEYDWSEYYVCQVEYDHAKYYFEKKQLIDPDGEGKADVEIPEYGFVLIVSKYNEVAANHFGNVKDNSRFYAHGLRVVPDDDATYEIYRCDTAPVIDGVVGGGEWSSYLVDNADENNIMWDYSQFEGLEYGVTADIYMTYDDDNLYFCVVVDSDKPNYCTVTQSDAAYMYKYCCIQVNVMNQSPLSEYVSEHYDYVADSTSVNDGVIRQYGFCVNNDGETISVVWMGVDKTFTGEAKVLIDDDNTTVYEVSIPWAEVNIDNIEPDKEISVSFSINYSPEEDAKANKWKNVRYLDGGGIIGRNDWVKMPTVIFQ